MPTRSSLFSTPENGGPNIRKVGQPEVTDERAWTVEFLFGGIGCRSDVFSEQKVCRQKNNRQETTVVQALEHHVGYTVQITEGFAYKCFSD